MNSAVTIYGALPAEWDAFVKAGLMPDMLPYVADPGVQAQPENPNEQTKRSWRPGTKMPGVVDPNGFGRGLRKWNEHITTERDIRRWRDDARLGFCVVTRRLRAIDVDVEDAAEAHAIESLIVEHLGLHPTRRRSNSSKFAVAVIVEGELGKTVVQTKSGGAVEFLGNKQQFFAVGMHKSGVRYTWDGGVPDQFDVVTLADYNNLIDVIAAQYGTEISRERLSVGTVERTALDIDDNMVEFMQEQDIVKHIGNDGKVFIRCPFEDQHTSPDADHTATVYFPAGVGGYTEGNFRCQHAHCAMRTKSEFEQAIGYYREQFAVVEVSPEEEAREAAVPDFDRNAQTGKILTNPSNVMRALRCPEWLGVDVAYDDFLGELVISPHGRREWRPFRDADYMRLRLRMEAQGLAVGSELIKEAVGLRADDNHTDSAKLWLKHEVPEWDGVPRIDSFYPRAFGTDDTPYTRAVGAYTWTALAARVLDPGHKVDMAPILSSGEGCRKSESIAAMVPDREFFVELDLGDNDKELVRLMRGKLISELGEMKGLNKRQAGETKAFITRRVDEWRPVYKEFAIKAPRRLLFIGTTNELEMLSDNTGRRRWLPMVITRADTDLIESERLQLWAEGVARFKTNGRVEFEAAEELAKQEHGKFEETHVWDELIGGWLDQPADFDEEFRNQDKPFTTAQILIKALGLPASEVARKSHSNAVASVLKRLGYESVQIRMDGHKPRVWRKTANSLKTASSEVRQRGM
jgi:hypothetical protein